MCGAVWAEREAEPLYCRHRTGSRCFCLARQLQDLKAQPPLENKLLKVSLDELSSMFEVVYPNYLIGILLHRRSFRNGLLHDGTKCNMLSLR
jgi:hypothetical protein